MSMHEKQSQEEAEEESTEEEGQEEEGEGKQYKGSRTAANDGVNTPFLIFLLLFSPPITMDFIRRHQDQSVEHPGPRWQPPQQCGGWGGGRRT